MKEDKARQAIVVAAVVITILINILANALPLNGKSTGAISDQFQVYFVPAGYVFSIWGLIYIGMIALAIYQALPAQRENPRLRNTGSLFALSCTANAGWLFLWHYELFPHTLIAMGTLLITLIIIYLRLGIGQMHVPAAERWLVHVPISIYLGWITVATIANVTSVLDFFGWTGGGISAEVWTVIMLLVGAGLGLVMSLTRGDVAYLLVLVWAFAGIAVKHAAVPVVATAAWAAAAVVAIIIPVGIWLKRRQAKAAP